MIVLTGIQPKQIQKMTTDNKYTIDDYTKDAMASKYEAKAKRMIRIELNEEFTTDQDTLLPIGTVIIGKRRYDSLKKIPSSSLVRTQKAQINIFEEYHGIISYRKKLQSKFEKSEQKLKEQEILKDQIKKSINKKSVWITFKNLYKKNYKVDFEENLDTLENIGTIVKYFSKDESFLECGVKNKNGKFLSKPSFNKGLCIVGGFGNGKTSIMNTMQKMFIGLDGYSFGRFSSHEIVRKYEEASKYNHPEILENLWMMLTKAELYIDDVKAEPLASAYGKKNLLNSLFQDRYNLCLKTHISINYAPGHNGDVLKSLQEFKTKYSDQVYDRIFEMYNIIEFNGKSFRGR
jgi:DNA replication protein DnaC